jgi:hypothetical protein
MPGVPICRLLGSGPGGTAAMSYRRQTWLVTWNKTLALSAAVVIMFTVARGLETKIEEVLMTGALSEERI